MPCFLTMATASSSLLSMRARSVILTAIAKSNRVTHRLDCLASRLCGAAIEAMGTSRRFPAADTRMVSFAGMHMDLTLARRCEAQPDRGAAWKGPFPYTCWHAQPVSEKITVSPTMRLRKLLRRVSSSPMLVGPILRCVSAICAAIDIPPKAT